MTIATNIKKKKGLIFVVFIVAILLIPAFVVHDDGASVKQTLNQYGDIICDGDLSNGKLRFMYDDNGSLTFYLDAKYREDTIFYKWIIYDLDSNSILVQETKTLTYYEWKDPYPGHFEIVLRIGATAIDMQTFSGTITLR